MWWGVEQKLSSKKTFLKKYMCGWGTVGVTSKQLPYYKKHFRKQVSLWRVLQKSFYKNIFFSLFLPKKNVFIHNLQNIKYGEKCGEKWIVIFFFSLFIRVIYLFFWYKIITLIRSYMNKYQNPKREETLNVLLSPAVIL